MRFLKQMHPYIKIVLNMQLTNMIPIGNLLFFKAQKNMKFQTI